ncbi:hypothetical protein MPH47_19345 [Psychrobacillus psychrodurans]|jgi:hypothetical protein|uniref:hypothetical protein n=1 Tax=Psychrobacillus TaxID=1221880 RepID=UPI0008E65A2F|nr:hypothetical protein [Psychrobacillus psychrodurans]MCK1999354.1 hypothetical protein [Psychrobacillus psychrodurans]MCZ8540818.1 hypothetical protein [Psychrobacillus psychrodurans]SFM76409.1 hypothetical protein SAMN05421832_106170 [Psychrobacillus psychrodurans]
MKKSKIILPIMVVVAVLATIILNQEEYSEVTFINKLLITVGAAIVSSVIGYFLLGADVDKVDPKPTNNTVNKTLKKNSRRK